MTGKSWKPVSSGREPPSGSRGPSTPSRQNSSARRRNSRANSTGPRVPTRAGGACALGLRFQPESGRHMARFEVVRPARDPGLRDFEPPPERRKSRPGLEKAVRLPRRTAVFEEYSGRLPELRTGTGNRRAGRRVLRPAALAAPPRGSPHPAGIGPDPAIAAYRSQAAASQHTRRDPASQAPRGPAWPSWH